MTGSFVKLLFYFLIDDWIVCLGPVGMMLNFQAIVVKLPESNKNTDKSLQLTETLHLKLEEQQQKLSTDIQLLFIGLGTGTGYGSRMSGWQKAGIRSNM